MAAFRAAERDETAEQFGKEHAEAAVDRMKTRLDKLKAIQVSNVTRVCVSLVGWNPTTAVNTSKTVPYLDRSATPS